MDMMDKDGGMDRTKKWIKWPAEISRGYYISSQQVQRHWSLALFT